MTRVPTNALKRLDLTREEILAFDPMLFSDEEKQEYISALYGDGLGWKSDLISAVKGMHRWEALLGEISPAGHPYHISSELLLDRAKRSAPQDVSATVTSFTDWLFRLYLPQRDVARLHLGRKLESAVQKRRLSMPEHSNWKLIYNGMAGTDESPLIVSQLCVTGHPLRARPDLVFREKRSGRILVLEIKVSDAPLPSDGWPNLRAQLWAYSKADKFRQAESILLVSEVWGIRGGLRRRGVLKWDASDRWLEQHNSALFQLYAQHPLSKSHDVSADT